jgi:Zn ribbon nucleic-acid-binding protein
VPLDDDGFLGRECPACERQFKWFHGTTADRPDDAIDPDCYFCPYCSEPAPGDQWWTNEQLEYLQGVAAATFSDAVDQEIEKMPRTSGGLIQISIESSGTVEAPSPLNEPNDMIMVASPCHSYEPIKIGEDWIDPLHCLICGNAFQI